MSVPETNARSPAPRKMATRMSSRRSSSSQYETSRSYMFQVSAFIASGRLNVIVAIGPATSNRISWLGSSVTVALLTSLHHAINCSADPRLGRETLHDLLLSQPRQLVVRHADLAQDLVAVLAQVRRNPLHGPRRLAQLDRHPQQRNLAEHRVRPRDNHLPMPDLGVIQRAIHRVDRTSRDAGFVEEPLPLFDRPCLQLLVDQLRQDQSVLVAVAVGLESRIVQPRLSIEQAAEQRPPLF